MCFLLLVYEHYSHCCTMNCNETFIIRTNAFLFTCVWHCCRGTLVCYISSSDIHCKCTVHCRFYHLLHYFIHYVFTRVLNSILNELNAIIKPLLWLLTLIESYINWTTFRYLRVIPELSKVSVGRICICNACLQNPDFWTAVKVCFCLKKAEDEMLSLHTKLL